MKKTAFISFALFFGLCSCSHEAGRQSLRTVVVTQPETMGLNSGTISLPGTIKEGQTVQVSFKTAGQIASLSVKEGDYVSKGQTIATLDAADYKIALEASEAQYRQLKNEVERIKTLYERRSVSKNEYEKAVAGLEQVTADLNAKKNQMQYTRLVSPASGYVQNIQAHVGEMVNAGTTVVSLIDVRRMEVEVGIPSTLYQHRGSLDNFSATIDGRKYPLTLLNIIPKAGASQQYTMLLALPSDASVKGLSGRNVEVDFSVTGCHESAGGMAIPESAIIYDGEIPCVWVLNADSTITRKAIQTATVLDGQVGVTGGLTGSETIIKSGAGMLHEGEKVKVLQAKSSTNPGGLL